MSDSINSNKKPSQPPKSSGRFATPEKAAQAKNVQLVAHIKKIGLKVAKPPSTSK